MTEFLIIGGFLFVVDVILIRNYLKGDGMRGWGSGFIKAREVKREDRESLLLYIKYCSLVSGALLLIVFLNLIGIKVI